MSAARYEDYFDGHNHATVEFCVWREVVDGVARRLTGGRDFNGEPLYGVVYRRRDNARVRVNGRDPSRAFRTLREAQAHVAVVDAALRESRS